MASRVTRGLGNTLRRPLLAVPLVNTLVGSVASRVIPSQPQGSSLHSASAKAPRKEPIYKLESKKLDGDDGDCSSDDSSDGLTSLPEVKKHPKLEKGDLAGSVMRILKAQTPKAISVMIKAFKDMEQVDVTVTRTYKDTETAITEVKTSSITMTDEVAKTTPSVPVSRVHAFKDMEKIEIVLIKAFAEMEETSVVQTAPDRIITDEVAKTTPSKKGLWRTVSQSKVLIAFGVILAVIGVLTAIVTFPAAAQAILVDLILKKTIGTAIKMAVPFLLPKVSTAVVALGGIFAVTYIANKLFDAMKNPVHNAAAPLLSGMNNLPGAGA